MSVRQADDDLCWIESEPPRRAPSRTALDDALRCDRVEFWYQPKIDLRQKRLIGVEAFARVRDSSGNLLPTRELLVGASKSTLMALTRLALVNVLKTSVNLAEIGVDVRLAVNVRADALAALPIVEIVHKYRPEGGRCSTLIFDMAEHQVLGNLPSLGRICSEFRASGLAVALDDVGGTVLSIAGTPEADRRIAETFARLEELRCLKFAEIKLHRSLVGGCATDPDKQRVCRHIIGLAHKIGSAVVAVGIERPAEFRTLRALDCDVGQGYLFGRPMSEEEFLFLLWERGVRPGPGDEARSAAHG